MHSIPLAVGTPSLYDFSRQALSDQLHAWGYSAFHADKLWTLLYHEHVTKFSELTEMRPALVAQLETAVSLPQLRVAKQIDSSDGLTRKFLLQLSDGETIETVLMRYPGRATVCISTQVGCAMGCVFCATGQMGFMRHLTPGEIVSQVLFVQRHLAERGDSLRNIVLMGMGEPLHNYDNTMAALDIIMDQKGLAIAPKHITLSTVGVVPAILRLAEDQRPIRLAVSLHAATDAERAALVPPARRWPLAELMAACRTYSEKRRRRIFFEWTLIDGENDTPVQARAVGELLQGMDAHLNLIPLNPTNGYAGVPTEKTAVKQFQQILAQYGVPSTVRQRRGIDIAAGCGQLRTEHQ